MTSIVHEHEQQQPNRSKSRRKTYPQFHEREAYEERDVHNA
jgi:hypothetical protein